MVLNCKKCDKIFKSKPYLVKQGKGLYCSRKCKEVSFKKPCDNCGAEMRIEPHRVLVGRGKFCSTSCASISRKGEKASRWKGGKASGPGGYTLAYAPRHPKVVNSRYVREHILVAEKALGRYLKEKEVIHHINEVKTDNRLENLYLFPSNSEHMRYHCNFRHGNCKEITQSNLI